MGALIVDWARSPFTKSHKGELMDIRPDEIAGQVARAVLNRNSIDNSQIDDIIVGCAYPEGEQGYNIGRIMTFLGNIPDCVPGQTINRLCGSSMEALLTATDKIGMVIGSGGSTIKEIVSEYDVTIDIADDGTVSIGGLESERIDNAIEKIQSIIKDVEVGDVYQGKVVKLMDFGAFCELEPGLTTLLHSSEISWSKKNVSVKKMFKVGDEINCVITEIDKEKRRVAISHRLTQENPFETFEKKFPVGSIVEGEIVNKNEYSLFVKVET